MSNRSVASDESSELQNGVNITTALNHLVIDLGKNSSGNQSLQDNHQELSSEPDAQSVFLVLIPIFIVITIALASAGGMYCARKQQRLENFKHKFIPMYSFNPGEEDEWNVLLTNVNPGSSS